MAETKRIAAIRTICAGKHAEIEAQAITEGWSRDETELAVLRANRPKAPAIHTAENAAGAQVLEAACMLTAGLNKVDELYDEPTLEAAQRRFRGGIGLQELLLEAAYANGYTGWNFRDSREVLRCAFGQSLQAGFSTIDIGGILSNVTNKFLLEGFFSVERTWRNLCAVRNVSDFKTVTSYRLIGKDQYEQVAPGGELKHGTLGEQAYTNKAETYGLILAIDRRDIINDDLGAITTVPRKLGRGSGLKINDVFWSIFMNNAAFFTAGNNNYLTGADTALGIDGLTKAEVAFNNLVDPDGKPLGVMPQVILVPTALSAMGTMLFKSLEFRDTTANTKTPVANPHQGKFRVEVSRYLSNTQYYVCSKRFNDHACKQDYVRAELLEAAIVQDIKAMFRDEDFMARVWEEANRRLGAEKPDVEKEIARVEAEAAKFRASIERYFEAFEAGTLKVELCNQKVADLHGRVEQLETEKRELEARRERLELPAIDREMLAALVDNFEEVLAAGPVPQKKHLLHRLVKKVLIHDRRTVEVWYALPNARRFEDWNKKLPEEDSSLAETRREMCTLRPSSTVQT